MLRIFLVCLLFTLGVQQTFAQSNLHQNRSIVITIDDLPINSLSDDIQYQREITQNILEALSAFEVPAIGFVNEGKLYENGELVEDRVDLLRMWLNSGMELGNHTYSHPDYHSTDFDQFQKEILKGEQITKRLLSETDDSLRYFRHPMLHVGNTSEKKEKLEKFLDKHGYITAPVTIDNSEWIFARAYEKALLDKDTAMMKKIGSEYITYMKTKVKYYESQSRDLFNREIRQTLLIHANALNGDYLDELLKMLRNRNYKFISLSSALEDPAYQTSDTYTGNGGISWIHRWAISQGKAGSFFAGEPPTPEFVMNYSGLGQE